jgi:F0F1-type ATP synthase gamma subunit
MKKIFVLLAAFAVLLSCGPKYSGSHGEKTQKDAEAEFVSSLTQADQDAVLELADDFMGKLKSGRVDEAVDMIYVLYNDVVYKKSDSYTAELIQRFGFFPVRSFKREYYAFSTEGNNDISYSYVFGDDASKTMKLMLNPVYVEGQWYLTFKEQGQSSKALPIEKQIHELAPAPDAPRLNKKSE